MLYGVQGLGFGVEGLEFIFGGVGEESLLVLEDARRVQCLGFLVNGSGLIRGLGFWVSGGNTSGV